MSNVALNWAYGVTSIRGMAKSLLVALADYADDKGECWPQVSTLAAKIGASPRSVHRYLDTLVDKGLVKKIARRGAHGCVQASKYCLPIEQIANLADSNRKPSANDGSPSSATDGRHNEPSGEPFTAADTVDDARTRKVRILGGVAQRIIDEVNHSALDPDKSPLLVTGADIPARWEREGLSIEFIILMIGYRVRKLPPGQAISTWAYFEDAVHEWHAEQLRASRPFDAGESDVKIDSTSKRSAGNSRGFGRDRTRRTNIVGDEVVNS